MMSSTIVRRSDPELADPKSRKAAHCCPHCERLLREAYQTEEGVRLCKECLHEIQRYIYTIDPWEWSVGTWPCALPKNARYYMFKDIAHWWRCAFVREWPSDTPWQMAITLLFLCNPTLTSWLMLHSQVPTLPLTSPTSHMNLHSVYAYLIKNYQHAQLGSWEYCWVVVVSSRLHSVTSLHFPLSLLHLSSCLQLLFPSSMPGGVCTKCKVTVLEGQVSKNIMQLQTTVMALEYCSQGWNHWAKKDLSNVHC